ncbi:MAG TPA: efflux RND transporter periplasmic adaptor subunit [Methylomirabilota bacterium]|nr:efflux RND transporter periplasmic adaptor subunit [Methylomirabilota bacterium]
MSRRLAMGLSIALAALATGACGRGETAAGAATSAARPAADVVVVPADSPQLQQIRVEPVKVAEVASEELVAPARIVADPNRTARVLPPVQGRVTAVLVRLGDRVEQGQPLVTLESPDADAAVATFLQAQAGERQARATLQKAETDLARASDLYQVRAVAEKDLLAAQNDAAQARLGLEGAEAARQQAFRKLELLGLEPATFRQAALVRAPISGKVLEVNVAPGEYRGAVATHSDTTTPPLLTIADLGTVWVQADVPEPLLRLVHVGQPVTITLVSFPDEVFGGTVSRIGDVLDPQTRSLKVTVTLPNPAGRFRPEMFGSIRQPGPRHSLPVLPADAVVLEYGRPVVFVERAPGQFERRAVATGARAESLVAITRGVQAGERIVVDGAVLLRGR